jgi:hypothetical protein
MLRAYPSGVWMAGRSAVQAFDRGSKSSLSQPTQTQATASDVSKELRLRDSLSSRYDVLIICVVVLVDHLAIWSLRSPYPDGLYEKSESGKKNVRIKVDKRMKLRYS